MSSSSFLFFAVFLAFWRLLERPEQRHRLLVAAGAGVLAALDDAGVRIAEGLGLNGLMDVEVMVRDGQPKVLEIDARLPSQTPTAVASASRWPTTTPTPGGP